MRPPKAANAAAQVDEEAAEGNTKATLNKSVAEQKARRAVVLQSLAFCEQQPAALHYPVLPALAMEGSSNGVEHAIHGWHGTRWQPRESLENGWGLEFETRNLLFDLILPLCCQFPSVPS